MGRSKLAAIALLLAVASSPRIARAQGAEDKAAAEAAFDEGKKLMAAHAYADACPKLAESQRLDPGIGTMLGLADCYEKNGQSASAWAEFKEAAAAAARKGDKREQLARDNAARLEPLLSKLVVRVGIEADIRGLGVKRDGIDVGRTEWGAAVPVDPGVHAVAASAPNKKEWDATISVPAQPGVQTIAIPELADAPLPPPAPPAAADKTSPEDRGPFAGPGRTQRILAVASGGVGVVGIVVGSIFGLQAKSKLDDSNANGNCDANDSCNGTGLGLRSDAKSAALVSTVGFVVGGVGLAGGAVLWFTAPKADSAAPAVGLRAAPGVVTVVGTW